MIKMMNCMCKLGGMDSNVQSKEMGGNHEGNLA
jgi:hypothetical protein